MRHSIIRFVFRLLGVDRLYEEVVVEDRLHDVKAKIRQDLQTLLTKVNQNNPYFKGKFTEFLEIAGSADDELFFAEYAKLPALSKQDLSLIHI